MNRLPTTGVISTRRAGRVRSLYLSNYENIIGMRNPAAMDGDGR